MRLSKQPPAAAVETNRTQTNRRNAQHSTGPRTEAGKQRSSQNAFQHGLYSKQLVLPDECAAEFDRLRATLRREHQPVNTTEEILVDELAQHFWRMRRFRELEARAWQPESTLFTTGILKLLARNLASAERGFFRTLTALAKLQKARGFVPQQSPAPVPAPHHTEFFFEDDDASLNESSLPQPSSGFVPHKPASDAPSPSSFE